LGLYYFWKILYGEVLQNPRGEGYFNFFTVCDVDSGDPGFFNIVMDPLQGSFIRLYPLQ
jgi:hypothetical protein